MPWASKVTPSDFQRHEPPGQICHPLAHQKALVEFVRLHEASQLAMKDAVSPDA